MNWYNTHIYFSSSKVTETKIELGRNKEGILLRDYGDFCEPVNVCVRGACDERIYGVEIFALTRIEALRIIDNLVVCHFVISGDIEENTREVILRMENPNSKNRLFLGGDSLFRACCLLKKVFGIQGYMNAVSKYFVAKEIYPLCARQMDPWNDPFVSEYLLSEQIRISNVIVACYGVLEELNLQVIASKENPSVINGEWNQCVYKDLSMRLKNKKIDPEQTLPWLTRNGVHRPFKSAVNCESSCEWSDEKEILDFNIHICDAILELSYMRSQLASHKLGDKALMLTAYDADNAFSLARRVLLKYFHMDCLDN
mgnify:CR=1 FL=1